MTDRHPLNIAQDSLKPTYRRLRGYAFDPSFANQLASSGVNTITYHIRWESLDPGPLGEYLEVMDIGPASGVIYPPVDLEDPQLLAQDGLPPSESNPQFHQQMVYAVAMLTIQNFEKALSGGCHGRRRMAGRASALFAGCAFIRTPSGGQCLLQFPKKGGPVWVFFGAAQQRPACWWPSSRASASAWSKSRLAVLGPTTAALGSS
jgi:hypothetical protein